MLDVKPFLPEMVRQIEEFVTDAGAERRAAAMVAVMTTLVGHRKTISRHRVLKIRVN